MPARTLVVANPASRSGSIRRRLAAAEPALRRSLGEFEIEWTRGPRDAERIAREAVRAGVERLVVAGGDGTTSEVATGLLAAQLGEHAELALLPLGTGGDLLRTLEIPRDLDRAIERVASGACRRIDAVRVRLRDHEGKDRTLYCANVASAGVSGEVTRFVRQSTKAMGGTFAFLLGTVRALVGYRAEPVRVELDGRVVHEGPVVLAAAANGRYFGGGMLVSPMARPDDGLLDVVVIPGMSRLRLIAELPRLYRGTHVDVPGVLQLRGRHVLVHPLGGSVSAEVDGEPLGGLPLEAEVLPGALRIVGSEA